MNGIVTEIDKKVAKIVLIAIIILCLTGLGAYWYSGTVFTGNTVKNMYVGHGAGLKISGIAGESITAGHVCFLDTDDQFWKADADVSANSTGMLGLALADISASATGTFLIYGYAVNSSWSINEAAIIYLSTTTGNFTETAPSGSGDVVRILGYGIDDSDTLFFCPDNSWVELE